MAKALYKEKLKQILKEIPQLSLQEREYVIAAFSRYLKGGLEKWEAEKILKELKLNAFDILSPIEVEKIKQKILSVFE